MRYEDFCDDYGFPATAENRSVFDKARESVALEILSLFGLSGSNDDVGRFLGNLEKATE